MQPPLLRTTELLERFHALCAPSAIQVREIGQVPFRQHSLPLRSYVHRGPESIGVLRFRIAVFGLVHGDEPAGGEAILRLLESTLRAPALLRGIDLFCYPICNPTGFELGTRGNAAGIDLNREFWRCSTQLEVQALEDELRVRRFDGLVALHADCDSPGLYAFARGAVTSYELVKPALRAAEGVLPRNCDTVIDGFHAQDGIVRDCYKGVLAPPAEQSPPPFEIILETPGTCTVTEQAEAAHRALLALLAELPRLSFGGPDI